MNTGLIVRLLVSVVAMVNAVCAIMNVPGLEITEAQLYEAVSVLGMVGTWAWGFWKNNSFTKEAQKADAYMEQLKAEKYGTDE